MNKQEIIDEINKAKEHLTNMEKMLKECNGRWKPELNEEYYYVNQVGATSRDINGKFDIDVERYRAYNCFKTKKQAELEAEKILVRRQLEDVARRLNKGQEIDWDDYNQPKYCISLYYGSIVTDVHFSYKSQGSVYCLDENFKDITIKEIGESRLIKYLRGK